MTEIAGKVALVAGATGPIGRAVAAALAAQGATVAALYRSSASVAEELIAGLDVPGVAVQADLTDPVSLGDALTRIRASLGPIEIVVNTVHTDASREPVAESDPETVAIHLSSVAGHAALCSGVVPGMREAGFGRIVYISGALMARPSAGHGLYAAAKSAATTLTRYLALEEGRHGILAGIVAPGRVVDSGDDDDLPPDMAALADKLRERLALTDFPTSAQVAESVLTLVTTDSLTGQILWVTGGEPIWS